MPDFLDNIINHLLSHSQRLASIEEKQDKLMATYADLSARIDSLPADIANAVVNEVKPLIGTGTGAVDTQPQIDALNAMPGTVATAVHNALAPATTPVL